MKEKYSKAIFIILFVFCLIAFLTPIWLFRFPPLLDYPQHLAIAHIYHNYSVPENLFQDQYLIRYFPKGYLFHTLFLHFANYLFPMETAGKLFLSLYIILLPLSILTFIKTLKGNKWLSFFSFLFIYNFPFFMGFMAFFMAIPLFLFGLSLLTVYAQKKGELSTPQLIIMTSLFVFVFFTHTLLYCPLLVFFVITLVFTHKKDIAGYKTLYLALPSIIILFLYSFEKWDFVTWLFSNKSGWPSNLFSHALQRIKELPKHCLRPLPKFHQVMKWFFIFWGALFLYGMIRKKFLTKAPLLLVTIWLLLCSLIYLLLPHAFGIDSYIGTRFAVLIPLLLVVLLSAIRLKSLEKVVLMVIMMGLIAFTFVNVIMEFSHFNKANQPLPKIINSLPKNKKVIVLYYPEELGRIVSHPWAFMHLGCYYTVWKDSLPVFIFPDSDNWRIIEKRKHVMKWGRHNHYDTWNPHRMIIPEGWQNYNYYLACGKVPLDHVKFFNVHHIDLIQKEGVWSLYKNLQAVRNKNLLLK